MDTFTQATAGHKEVRDDWMAATGLRYLILEDPVLLWLKFHGEAHGFKEDPKQYSFLEFIGQKGGQFEAKWIKEVAPESVQALDGDTDVRKADGVRKTLELMGRRTPVIAKAALWWAPERIYGSADLIVLASWLYARFPHLARDPDAPDHYVVLDCKFSTGLDESKHKTDLAMNSAQVRLYSYMLGNLQGYMPSRAFLITRDRPFDPLPVEVDQELASPLNDKLAELRDRHIHIKMHGGKYLPWRDKIVAPNFSNDKDEPWHESKKRLASEFMPGRPLEWLPHIGKSQVIELNKLGISCLDHAIANPPSIKKLEKMKGIGKATAPRIHAVLQANRTGKASSVPAKLLPPQSEIELFVDFEYFTNVNVDFDSQWPALDGKEIIFMIGVGWVEKGQWHWKQFIAEREDEAAEGAMLEEFLSFLDRVGVFGTGKSVAFYHWSNAEVWQSNKASMRHGLDRLGNLPWHDLQKPFHSGPIALPGAWGFGLKEVASALGNYAPDFHVAWPEELGAGLNAMVVGWEAFRKKKPLETPEMRSLEKYLEVDCKAMWHVLKWMRACAIKSAQVGLWYRREARSPHEGCPCSSSSDPDWVAVSKKQRRLWYAPVATGL